MARKRSAKGQFVAGRAGVRAKVGARSGATKATRVKRRRRNPEQGPVATALGLTANPHTTPLSELAEFILPGFAGYGATKFISRITYVQLSKRFPKAGKHLAVGSTVASFLAAWLLVHRIKKLEKFHTPIVVGSAIAALQTIVNQYLPKYGWMVGDLPTAAALPAASTSLLAAPAAPLETLFPGGPEVVDEDAPDALSDLDLGSLGLKGADEGEDYLGSN